MNNQTETTLTPRKYREQSGKDVEVLLCRSDETADWNMTLRIGRREVFAHPDGETVRQLLRVFRTETNENIRQQLSRFLPEPPTTQGETMNEDHPGRDAPQEETTGENLMEQIAWELKRILARKDPEDSPPSTRKRMTNLLAAVEREHGAACSNSEQEVNEAERERPEGLNKKFFDQIHLPAVRETIQELLRRLTRIPDLHVHVRTKPPASGEPGNLLKVSTKNLQDRLHLQLFSHLVLRDTQQEVVLDSKGREVLRLTVSYCWQTFTKEDGETRVTTVWLYPDGTFAMYQADLPQQIERENS